MTLCPLAEVDGRECREAIVELAKSLRVPGIPCR